MGSRGLGSIEQLRALWHGETGSAGRRAAWAFFGAGLVAATLVARLGHDWSRALAIGVVILGLVPALIRLAILRRQREDPRAVMSATILRTEPELARAALRALTLTKKTADEPERGSKELAELHFARLLGRAALDPLAARAGRVAWRASIIGAVLACAAFVLVVVDPFRMVEGVDVLLAYERVAPVELSWVEMPRLSAEPPSYLNMPRRPMRPYFPAALPVGTIITVHAVPLRDGRELVLTDGVDEVAFHDDGEGAVVARWRVDRDASLAISAQFGDVRIEEPERLEIQAIIDHAPHVRLSGAPATYRLLDKPHIPIHWEAIDDHGVREVALVLRAGEREERRELSRPQGGVAVDRGGIELQAGDAFLDKSYLPVEVTIEALDNDPVTGPKWGRSAPIIVIPPQIGEREALRYAALARGRNAVIDLLAGRIDRGADNLVGYAARESQLQKNVVTQLNTIATESFGGLHLHGRLAALVRGQLELLDKALQQARVAPGQATHDKLVEQTETALLAVDSALGALGVRDSRESALKLSDVALDVAAAIELSREPAERTRATRRFDADLIVLDEGGKNLLRLGELGVDLGEIVENGLRRIRRGWSAGDRHHARLAALDLAARLRTPDPSFRSSGGGQGQGGTEAGGMPQPGEGEASSAASDAAAVEQALEQLRQEHAAEMAAVERALDSALDPQDKSALQEQLREAAKKVREAVANLPQQASDPSSARASAAQGRSQAEAMAGALERGELSEATEHGKRALDSLKEAQERGGKSDAGSERQMGEESGKARGKLEQLMDEAKRALDKTRREASEGARGDLQRSAKRERELAERAREIRQRSSESEAPLPQEMLERLREAAETMERAGRELGGGDGPKGQETQREAQRLLEMSQPESPQNEREREEQGDGRDFARDADVPPEARDESADAFRKRVTEGLGRKAPPHLRDALRRYTEGLLR